MTPGHSPAWQAVYPQVVDLWLEGSLTKDEIGARFGFTGKAVQQKMRRNGYQKRRGAAAQYNHDNLDRHLAEVLAVRWKTDRVKMACKLSGITYEVAVGPSRTRGDASRRWRAMYLLSQSGWASTDIGRSFNRDHTTVLNGLRMFTNGMPAEKVAAE